MSDTREASDSDSSSSDSVDVDDIFNYKAKDFDYTHKTLTEIQEEADEDMTCSLRASIVFWQDITDE